MPSPFPGMDPYLEHPEVFPNLHDNLITYLMESLQLDLPEPYYATVGRRNWIEVSERYVGPDVNVVENPRRSHSPAANNGGAAVATASQARPVVVHVPHDERREPFLDVYAGTGAKRRLVTTVEVLSPSNKTPGEQGRDLYLRKQQEILQSKVHLVEIDLLRAGEHTTAVPKDRLAAKVEDYDYHVCIHHFDNVEDFFVYPISLPQPLPVLAIPLLPGDGAVDVDLQAVFNRCYDAGPYRREIQYAETEPVPPLPAMWKEWADSVMKS